MLEAEEDRYDGIIIKPDSLPADPSAFKAALEESLQVGSQQRSGSSSSSSSRPAVEQQPTSKGGSSAVWHMGTSCVCLLPRCAGFHSLAAAATQVITSVSHT
jgi:hypothetical protein